MTESEKMSILTKEYIFLMNAYEMFDQRALLIKGWAFTLISGGIGFSYVYPEGQVAILVLSLLGSIVFWYLEATWKQFQYNFTPRIKEIEEFMHSTVDVGIVPLQVYTQWMLAFHKNHNKGSDSTEAIPYDEHSTTSHSTATISYDGYSRYYNSTESTPEGKYSQFFNSTAFMPIVFTPYLYLIIVILAVLSYS